MVCNETISLQLTDLVSVTGGGLGLTNETISLQLTDMVSVTGGGNSSHYTHNSSQSREQNKVTKIV